MAAPKCICGEPFDQFISPSPTGFLLMHEMLMEELVEGLAVAHETADEREEFKRQAFQLLYQGPPSFPHAQECLHCGRLAVFPRGAQDRPVIWLQRERSEGDADALVALFD